PSLATMFSITYWFCSILFQKICRPCWSLPLCNRKFLPRLHLELGASAMSAAAPSPSFEHLENYVVAEAVRRIGAERPDVAAVFAEAVDVITDRPDGTRLPQLKLKSQPRGQMMHLLAFVTH